MTALLDRLLRAGTASDADISVLAKEAGVDAVLAALVDEILFRASVPANPEPVHIALDVTHDTEVRRVLFHCVGGERITRWDGETPAEICRELGMSLTHLVRRLYGRPDQRRTGDFSDVFLPTRPEDLSRLPGLVASTSLASGALMTGLSIPRDDLGALCAASGSDKWASFHWYTGHYEREFAPYRDEPVRILEIGIGGFDGDLGGGSLRTWKRYFHRGQVFGIDLFDKSALNEPRQTALVCDQSDPRALTALAREYGPFDIVIDDGSHHNEHVRISFDALFPHVKPGGLYVIEDMMTAYIPSMGGTAGPSAGPDTSIGLIKRLVDDLHHHEHTPGGTPTVTQRDVVAVRAYRNIAFVEKGTNGEVGIPPWMDDAAWAALGALPPTE
ncbi:class I SAM-dependent methyltransferase [Nocardia sp. CDC159]|uniref:Class I SAM-dependent methyltransferase n=1 Tax=Nocardia pulmonis TaxID=2951408 RepID=A0A9X2IUY1_9NOCA|nr:MULTISPECIES: class I SAM-dependent methyltransferase [Nocardia]MCM6771864.1 class I SAM-dependent methyltransferase [Nocardia pulmonis]MCM6785478.1 class I SAM-dependent methyltransferase [Nocardia sp. CDC159]